MSQLTEMNEQYGNSGYNQIDGYGANPYGNRSGDWELVRFNDHAHLAGRSLAG